MNCIRSGSSATSVAGRATSEGPATSIWVTPPSTLSVSRREVHVWRVSIRVARSDYGWLSTMLSSDEQTRAERFVSQVHGRRFVVGRGAQRDVLSRYLLLAPNELGFRYSTARKPSLESWIGSEIRFNASKSGDLDLIAVTYSRDVGVDLEAIRPMSDLTSTVEQFFSRREQDVFETVATNARLQSLFECWTRKEAYIKAVRERLLMRLASCDGFWAKSTSTSACRSRSAERGRTLADVRSASWRKLRRGARCRVNRLDLEVLRLERQREADAYVICRCP